MGEGPTRSFAVVVRVGELNVAAAHPQALNKGFSHNILRPTFWHVNVILRDRGSPIRGLDDYSVPPLFPIHLSML